MIAILDPMVDQQYAKKKAKTPGPPGPTVERQLRGGRYNFWNINNMQKKKNDRPGGGGAGVPLNGIRFEKPQDA